MARAPAKRSSSVSRFAPWRIQVTRSPSKALAEVGAARSALYALQAQHVAPRKAHADAQNAAQSTGSRRAGNFEG